MQSLQGTDVVYGNAALYDPDTGETEQRSAQLAPLGRFMSLFHPAVWVARTTYERLGGYRLDYRLAMDSEWLHRALAAGAGFAHIDACLASMSLGGASHVQLRAAMAEFRRSTIEHGLCRTPTAYFYQLRQTLVHMLLSAPAVRSWYVRARGDRGG